MLPIHAARIAAGARVVDSKRRKTLGMNAPMSTAPRRRTAARVIYRTLP